MKKLFCLLLIVVPLSSLAAEALVDYSRMLGTYRGEVENGDGFYTVETTFTLLSGGRLRGEYQLVGVPDPLRGYMTGAFPEGRRQVSFEWQDRDGEGFALLNFSSDYSSFDGWWGDYNSNNMHVWKGEKISDEPLPTAQ